VKHAVVAAPLAILLVLGFKGCGSTKPPASEQASPTASQRTQVADYASLLGSLRAKGAKVEAAGEVSQPFFSVPGKVLKVNGGDVQVFEYADAHASEAQASLVSADGSEVGRSKVGWVGPPHFFRRDKIIALYIGDDPTTIKALSDVLGTQFAGK